MGQIWPAGHGLGTTALKPPKSKATKFYASYISEPAWWSWQTVLNYSHISIKLQADSNNLASQ